MFRAVPKLSGLKQRALVPGEECYGSNHDREDILLWISASVYDESEKLRLVVDYGHGY